MPSHKVHRYLDKLVFGKSFSKVHAELDRPAYVLGKRHRMIYHDPISAMLIGRSIAGEEGARSALLHIIIDQMDSQAQKALRKLLK